MDYKYIEQLLERYFNAETSLEEESILRTFFSQTDVPAEMELVIINRVGQGVFDAVVRVQHIVHNMVNLTKEWITNCSVW